MTRIHGHKLGPPVRKLLIVGIGLLSFLLSTITDAGDLPLVQRDAIAISGAADIPVRLEVADLDGDDQLDVIAANESDDKILWYRNTGGSPPAFEPLITAYLPSRGNEWVDAADVDGDGDTDLFYAVSAVHSVSSDAFGWMENAAGDASEWVEHRIADGMANSWAIEAADIDGDSDLDAFFAVEDDGVLGWFENLNGTGTQWAAHTFDTNAPGVRAIRVKDIDGDGDPDLVAAVFDINTAAWYANNVTNGGSFVRHELFNGLNGAYDLDVQDLDGDTDPDIVVVANTSGQIVWFQNDGSTSPVFAIHPFPSFVTAPTSVSIGDLDGDTNADIVVGLELPDDEILWFESDGSATPTFTEHTMEAFSNGRTISLLAVDIDQDSDTDLLAGFIFGIQLFHNDSTDPVAWVL